LASRRPPADLPRMKHAGAAALDALELDVLAHVRRHPGLKERSRGVFHWKSRAFLHFHEDATGVFADLRRADGWTRMRVVTAAERSALVRAVAGALSQESGRS
jgi:hypothetical protein